MNRVLKVEEERIGQYSNLLRAKKAANALIAETGIKHIAVKTVTYRNLEPIACYTVKAYLTSL